MSQNNVDFSGNPSGAGLLDGYLDKDQQNVLTSNSGIQRPSYAVAGTKWLDTSVTPWLWKMYDGTSDVTLGTVNPSTHLFTPAGVLPSQEDQSGKFLQTDGSKTVWTDAVDYTNITNCITAIPRNIKLELNNGTLTLKAGSKVYVPNGITVFDEVIIQSDASITPTYGENDKMLVYYRDGFLDCASVNIIFSQMIEPTSPGDGWVWFDIGNNIIKRYNINNSTWEILSSTLPVAEVQSTSNAITSINQVFNGFGYIGRTVFTLPGVEGLIPNGFVGKQRNNTKFTTTTVLSNTSIFGNRFILLSENVIRCPSTDEYIYNSSENINVYGGERGLDCIAGSFSVDIFGRITSFNPKTVFQAIDAIDSLPPQAGNADKFLMTDGTTASWANAAQKDKEEFIEATWTFGASDLGNLEGGQIQLKMDPEHASYQPMVIDANSGVGRIYGGPVDDLKVFGFNFTDGTLTLPATLPSSDISYHAATTEYVRNVTRPNYGAWYMIGAGTFVAPADGWIGIYGNVHHNLYFLIVHKNLEMVRGLSTTTTGVEMRSLIPVVWGETYTITNNAENGNQYFIPNYGGV